MSNTEKTPTEKTSRSPLFYLASALSVFSAVWTAYSSWDLLDRHPMALVAGATYDILWMSLIYTDWKNRITGKKSSSWPGWVMLAPVVVLLTWHGHEAWGVAGAIAGPFLAIGTKVLWFKAIDDSLDEIAITKGTAQQKIDLLNAETDVILKESEALIRKEKATSEADHQKTLAEKRRKHELKMADLNYEQEEKRVSSQHRGDMLVSAIENTQFEKLIALIERTSGQGGVIPGEVVAPQVPATPQPKALTSDPQASDGHRPKMYTVNIDKGEPEVLTEAQKARRRLAALFYLHEDEAAAQSLSLTQTAFAAMMGETKVQVSRACREFKREDIGDIEVYREEMKKTG